MGWTILLFLLCGAMLLIGVIMLWVRNMANAG